MGTVAHPSTLMERPQSTAEPVIGAIQEVGASLAQAVRTQMEPVA